MNFHLIKKEKREKSVFIAALIMKTSRIATKTPGLEGVVDLFFFVV